MHIHVPKPLHGWREFVGEVGIIVLGVLIALAAEQAVEAWHWNEKIKDAEGAMRLELAEDDGPQAYGRIVIGSCLDEQLNRIHEGADAADAGQLRKWTFDYLPPYRSWDSEAWKTVLGSEVGSHMSSEELVRWSSPYRVINDMTASNKQERDLATDLREAVPRTGDLSPQQRQSLRQLVAQLRSYNSGLFRASQLLLARSESLGAPVAPATRKRLLVAARELYGTCSRVPDVKIVPLAGLLRGNLKLQPIQNGM